MASSNRHWPSMFKSKPLNPHYQCQHDLNSSLLSGCHRSNPYTSGVDERSPDPKPRWNPKPEQIRILEAIFNSGMVNPPRDEIRKIRAQLLEFGQVGDANVFYWFQNRKSRSKHKNRQPPKNQTNQSSASARITSQSTIMRTPSSSSFKKSSSELSNPNNNKFSNTILVQHDQPFMFPALQNLNFDATQCLTGFPDQQQQMMTLSNNNNNNNLQLNSSLGPCTEFLFSELIHHQHGGSDSKKDAGDKEKLMMMKLGYATPSSTTSPVLVNHDPVSSSSGMPLPSTLYQLQGANESGGSSVVGSMKSTVFINDVAFEVNSAPFHVREAFGDDAVLLHSTGQPLLTNEWGMTLQPLQHGGFYYLI